MKCLVNCPQQKLEKKNEKKGFNTEGISVCRMFASSN